jgi:hypothetical protein
MALSYLSLVSTPLEVISSTGAVMGNATSFFLKRADGWNFLVTNWHVVTGRNPESPTQTVTGAVPVKLRLKLHKNVGGQAISRSQKISYVLRINDQSGNEPTWFEHPRYRHRFDVVVLKFPEDDDFRSKVTCHYIDEYKQFDDRFTPSAMNDVFVIGYPWGLTGGDMVLPLYKRGIIASEPILDYGELPCFLIDCRTASAMSGSPVICQHTGIWSPSGTLAPDSTIGTVENFAGVYSGRLIGRNANLPKTDEISDIGIVWKVNALREIVNHGLPGTRLSELAAV